MSARGFSDYITRVPVLAYAGLSLLLGAAIVGSLLQRAIEIPVAIQWERMSSDPALIYALQNTGKLYLGAMAMQLGIAIVATLYCQRAPGPLKAVLVAPYAAGVVAPAFSLYVLLSPALGPLNVGILGTRDGASFVVMLIDTWQWVGVLLLACFVQLEQLPRSHFEQARLEAISRLRRWRLISWPRLRTVFLFYAIVRAVDWARKVDVAKAMFGEGGGPGGGAESLGLYLSRLYYSYPEDSSYAAYLTLLQLVVLAGAVGLIFRGRMAGTLTGEA